MDCMQLTELLSSCGIYSYGTSALPPPYLVHSSRTFLIYIAVPVIGQFAWICKPEVPRTHIYLNLLPIRILYRRIIALYPYILYKLGCQVI